MRTLKGTNHGYRTLFFNLGGNNCLRCLDCRQHDRCGLAFRLAAYGTTCGHSRISQPLWVGSRRKDTVGFPLRLNRQPLAYLIRPSANNPRRHRVRSRCRLRLMLSITVRTVISDATLVSIGRKRGGLNEPRDWQKRRGVVWVGRRPANVCLCRDMNRVQGRTWHQVEAYPRPSPRLWLSHHRTEWRGRTDPSEGHAGDPDDRRRTGRLDAGAVGQG